MKKIASLIIFLFISMTSVQAQDKNPLALTMGLNTFAFDLYKQLNQTSKTNMVFSPYSLSSLLVILSQGAANTTLSQMTKVLHLPENQNDIFAQLNQIDHSMQTPVTCLGKIRCLFKDLVSSHKSQDGLQIANGIWIQKNLMLDSSFVSKVNGLSTAKIYQVDFNKNPEAARKVLNNWVEQRTNGLIEDLFFPGTILSSTKIVLANAIYFKGLWESPFDKSETRSEPFNLNETDKVNVPMMHQTKSFPYFENENSQILILPYSKTQLAMAIVLPKKDDDFQGLLQGLDGSSFDKLINQSYPKKMHVYLPTFNFSSNFYDLKQPLQALGIRAALTNNADFSHLSIDKLRISEVIQKVVVNTDEMGTTAAAATGIILTTTAISTPPPTFRADHPFLFIIFDRETHVILFIGKVVNPLIQG